MSKNEEKGEVGKRRRQLGEGEGAAGFSKEKQLGIWDRLSER